MSGKVGQNSYMNVHSFRATIILLPIILYVKRNLIFKNPVLGGGNIKIETKKLKVEAKSKIGSLDNATHKPLGGDKKVCPEFSFIVHYT